MRRGYRYEVDGLAGFAGIYFSVGHIRFVKNNSIDHLAQVVQIERVPDGGFRTAGDEDEEWQFAMNKRCQKNSHNVVLDIRVLTFI